VEQQEQEQEQEPQEQEQEHKQGVDEDGNPSVLGEKFVKANGVPENNIGQYYERTNGG
jgi:hypothetical protein